MSPLSPQAPVELSAHLLHDLRTPVNAILGYSNLLVEDTPKDAELHRRVEPVRRSGECLNDLIGALPRSGPLPADWLALMQAPLAQLETGIAALRTWDNAPQEDVDHIETARGRLLAMLARLAINEDPTAPETAPALPRPLPDAPFIAAGGGGSAILIVDDNDLNRDLLSRRLQQLGHEVDEVGDG
ncbi:MAG TPA: histidine kinase dimerization/phospho-acceptor domain-containing protein, partial [Immundisolibacter sp.]|nr:histidine kinase dimerization/phospho-acceptor domain-containing protein [Immundisolibacter sp.]